MAVEWISFSEVISGEKVCFGEFIHLLVGSGSGFLCFMAVRFDSVSGYLFTHEVR